MPETKNIGKIKQDIQNYNNMELVKKEIQNIIKKTEEQNRVLGSILKERGKTIK